MKKRLNEISTPNIETSTKTNEKHVVYGWCVMASEQNKEKNKIIIYTDRQKPKRGNQGWEG